MKTNQSLSQSPMNVNIDKPRPGIIPNSTTVPNLYLDELMVFLTDTEFRVLIYITRRILGFHKRQDRIAISQIVGGIKSKDGRQLDYGAGVSEASARTAIRSLCALRIIRESAPFTKVLAAEYELQFDESLIDWSTIFSRKNMQKTADESRMKEARKSLKPKAGGGLNDSTSGGLNDSTSGGLNDSTSGGLNDSTHNRKGKKEKKRGKERDAAQENTGNTNSFSPTFLKAEKAQGNTDRSSTDQSVDPELHTNIPVARTPTYDDPPTVQITTPNDDPVTQRAPVQTPSKNQPNNVEPKPARPTPPAEPVYTWVAPAVVPKHELDGEEYFPYPDLQNAIMHYLVNYPGYMLPPTPARWWGELVEAGFVLLRDGQPVELKGAEYA